MRPPGPSGSEDDHVPVIVGRGGAPADDELLDVGRPRRRWTPLLVAVVIAAAGVAVVRTAGESSSEREAARTPTSSPRTLQIPSHASWPVGGFGGPPPGECPRTVFCRVTTTPPEVTRAIRTAVRGGLGTPTGLKIVTRVRPATVSDYESVYSRVVTAGLPHRHRLRIVVSRSPVDVASVVAQTGTDPATQDTAIVRGYYIAAALAGPQASLTDAEIIAFVRLVRDRRLVPERH